VCGVYDVWSREMRRSSRVLHTPILEIIIKTNSKNVLKNKKMKSKVNTGFVLVKIFS
jgi:hypothetical protein